MLLIFSKLNTRFGRLLALPNVLKSSMLSSEKERRSSEIQRKLIVTSLQTQLEQNSASIVEKFGVLRTAVRKIFEYPVVALQRSPGSSAQLTHEEIDFVQNAYHLNSGSRDVFTLLARDIACPEKHDVRLDLSSFMGPGSRFKLLSRDCGSNKCKW